MALNVRDIGAATGYGMTRVTFRPKFKPGEAPEVGDMVVALVVKPSGGWITPPGWTREGEAAFRTMIGGDLPLAVTFDFTTAGESEIWFYVVRPQ